MKLQITDILVEIRMINKPGAVKAYADIQIRTDGGVLREKGYAVIQKDGAAPFIGFPSRPGSTPGKFFPIVDAEGDIRSMIFTAILTAYRKSQEQ
jgi:DNA-binding cell septation regulator SpoVG